MSLTKVSSILVKGPPVSVWEFMTAEEIADCQVFPPQINVTTKIQTAIDSGKNLYYPKGWYRISNVVFRVAGQEHRFDGGVLWADPNTTGYKAPVEITSYYQQFYNLAVDQWFNTNYTAAIWWHKYAGDSYYPQHIHIYNLATVNCLIGILYGDTTSPVDAPVSENHIFGWRTRGCERCIYMNQPNGFLTITGSTLLASPNEWPLVNPGVYSDLRAAAIEIQNGILNVSNSFPIKNTTQVGYAIIVGQPGGTNVYPTLTMSNCTPEIICQTWFVGDLGVLNVSNWQQPYWANGTGAPWLETSGTGKPYAAFDNCRYDGHLIGSANGVVKTDNPQAIVKFSNCRFGSQNGPTLLDSANAAYWAYGDVSFKQCTGYDITGEYKVTSSDNNLAWEYAVPDIGDFTVAADAGTSAAIVTVSHPTFNRALELTGALSKQCFVTTNKNIQLPSSGRRFGILELTMKSDATTTQFYGRLDILYYDASDSFIGSADLSYGNGEVAFLESIAGLQDWRTVRRIIPMTANVARIEIRFGVQNYAQKWQIGGIKVY